MTFTVASLEGSATKNSLVSPLYTETGGGSTTSLTTTSDSVVITAMGTGSCTLTCTVDGDVTNSTTYTISVTAQAISSVSLSSSASTIYYQGTTSTSTVTAEVKMNDGTFDGTYSWSGSSSYAEYVASSDTATVTATNGEGSITLTCTATFINGTEGSASTSIFVRYRYYHSLTVRFKGLGDYDTTDWSIGSFYSSSISTEMKMDDLIYYLYNNYGTGTLPFTTNTNPHFTYQGSFDYYAIFVTDMYCTSSTEFVIEGYVFTGGGTSNTVKLTVTSTGSGSAYGNVKVSGYSSSHLKTGTYTGVAQAVDNFKTY